jgi:hypothetical protein
MAESQRPPQEALGDRVNDVALKKAVQVFIVTAFRAVENEIFPIRKDNPIIDRFDGHIVIKYDGFGQAWILMQANRECIEALAEGDICADLILANNKYSIGRVEEGLDEKTFIKRRILLPFFEELIYKQGPIEPHATEIDALYENLESFLLKKEANYRVLVTLEGFESDEADIEIGVKSAKLRKLTDMDRNAILRVVGDNLFLTLHEVSGITHQTHGIEISYSWEKRPAWACRPDEYLSQTTKIITALRLLKPGRIGGYLVFHESVTWQPGVTSYIGKASRVKAPMNPYRFEETDVRRLKQIVKVVPDLGLTSKYTKVALVRFNAMYEEYDANERLIDCMIGFESLFLPNVKDELSHRLALRTAVLLGQTVDERWEIFKKMEVGYTLRGSIVHGEKFSKETIKILSIIPGELHGVALTLEDYLRRSLQEFLANPCLQDADKINTYLNQRVLGCI